MRILYVTDALDQSGVTSKSLAQAAAWEAQGHSSWLATARNPEVLPLARARERARRAAAPRSLIERARGELDFRVLYANSLLGAVRRHRIDVVYTREIPFVPALPWLMRQVPTVFEINGDALSELPRLRQRLVRKQVRAYEIGHAAGVVYVSNELEQLCGAGLARRSTVIANPCNGPDDAALPLRERPKRPTLVMVGTPVHAWNGFDKFLRMAELLPELDFLVIGAEVQGPHNLRSMPHLPQAEVDRMLRRCSVGVGSLGMHRAGLQEASPLKSRNYLSLGLPLIQAYIDTDLTEADGCVLTLPNVEDNVAPQLDRIRAFAQRAFEDARLSERALELARGRLSIASKEQLRLAFMAQCAGSAR